MAVLLGGHDPPDVLQQHLVVDRLFEEIGGPAAEGAGAGGHVAIGGDEDDRQADLAPSRMAL